MEEDNQSAGSPAQSNPGTPLPSNPGTPRNDDVALVSSTSCYPAPQTSASSSSRQQPKPKYSQLLAIIEELGKDIRPTYAGSRSSAERLKRGIVHARILVRECLMETERNKIWRMSALCASEPYFIAEDKTHFYADSVEWCPFKSFNNVFVCGTYQLDEEQSSSTEGQVRQGNAILYKLGTKGSDSNPKISLSVEDCISTSGILDMKWSSSLLYNNIALALVSSDGKVLLKYMKEDENGISLSRVTDLQLAASEEKILLSVDWAKQQDNSAAIITSDNKGSLHYLQVRETEMCVVCSWKAHTFESWVASFNYSDQNIVYSGGDDCCFNAWDLRTLSSPIFVKKNHSMGVTAISKSKLNENLLVSGSYDENVSLWDARQFKTPLSNLSIGGGIWRLKWHPTNPQYLLAAAMHNGFHVLSLKNDRLKLEQSYNHHKSLAYGVDWSHLTIESVSSDQNNQLLPFLNKINIRNVIASCSFYDNLLSVWGINLL